MLLNSIVDIVLFNYFFLKLNKKLPEPKKNLHNFRGLVGLLAQKRSFREIRKTTIRKLLLPQGKARILPNKAGFWSGLGIMVEKSGLKN
jgi:hypothetical protein